MSRDAREGRRGRGRRGWGARADEVSVGALGKSSKIVFRTTNEPRGRRARSRSPPRSLRSSQLAQLVLDCPHGVVAFGSARPFAPLRQPRPQFILCRRRRRFRRLRVHRVTCERGGARVSVGDPGTNRFNSMTTGSRVGGGASTTPGEYGPVSGRTEHLRYPRCHPQRRSGSDDEHHDPPDRRARQPPNRLEHAQLLDLLRGHLRHLPRAVFGLSRRRRRRRRDARGGEARAGAWAHRAGQRATRGRQGHRS